VVFAVVAELTLTNDKLARSTVTAVRQTAAKAEGLRA
jgi:hypothetical protein